MSTEQTLLFIAVMALSLALVLGLTVPRLRRLVTSVARGRRSAAPDGAGHASSHRPGGSGEAVDLGRAGVIRAGAHGEPPQAGAAAGGPSTDPTSPAVAREPGRGAGLAVDRASACPACRRRYPPGFRFCPVDARPLTLAGEVTSVASAGLERLRCRECRRLFLADAGARFCPFDGEPLGRPLGHRATQGRAAGSPPPPPPGAAIPVKICPTCSERVHTGASQCQRDGTELVSLN
jgi:hypothetical protein